MTIKIARVGGVGPAALLRDVAVDLGLPVTVEDTGGSDIDTAAMAHLSLSTPEELRIHTVDFNAWVTVGNATGMPPAEGGQLRAPDGPASASRSGCDELGEPFGVWCSARRRLGCPRPPRARRGGDDGGAAARPPRTRARTRSGIERRDDHAVSQHGRRPISGSTSRMAATASTPCSSAASRRSRDAAASPASATTAGDERAPGLAARGLALAVRRRDGGDRERRRRAGRRRAAAAQSRAPGRAGRGARPAPIAHASGGRATRSTAPVDLARRGRRRAAARSSDAATRRACPG